MSILFGEEDGMNQLDGGEGPEHQFLRLAKQYEEHKEQGKHIRERLDQTMTLLGEGTMLQDPYTKTVYKIVKPKGTYVEYKEIGYDRTALPGESRGTLSKKEAEEAGFKLPGKEKV